MRSYALALVAAAALLLAPSLAAADEPTAADLFSSAQAVRVSGDLAYVASTAGLSIYDVSDRANPRRLSQLFLDRSGSFRLEVANGYAYVLSGTIVFEKSFLRVVDVRDPLAPRLVGEFDDLAEARVQAMLLTGTTLALADGNAVDLVDVSDPAHPTRAARLPILDDPEQIVSLAANGSTLFAAWVGLGDENLTGGVTSVDVSDPSAPVQTGVFALEGTPSSIASSGATLYVGETLTAVVVLDAGDPRQLVQLAKIDYPLTGQVDVFARGDRLFTGAETQEPGLGVRVFDITDPASPQPLAETRLSCRVVGMDYDPGRGDAFMPCSDATGSGWTAFDVAPGGALTALSSVFVPQVSDVEAAESGTTFLAASDSLLAVRPAGGGVEVVGRLSLGQRAFHVQLSGTRAYVSTADNADGVNTHLRIVDVADPADMRLVGSLDLEGEGYLLTSKRFYVDGETLYVAAPRGLDIYDASDPAAPARLGTFATPDVVENVLVRDGVAYLNTLRVDDGTQVADVYAVKVKKPSRPKLMGRRRGVDNANYVHDLALAGDRLYLLDAGPGAPFPFAGDGRLLVFDVRRKAPRLVSKTFTSPSFNGYAQEIAISGDVAYVADGLDGVTVISVAGNTPEFVRAIDTPGFAVGVWVDAAGAVSVADESSFQVYGPEQ